jgi:hypothetical protein
MRPFCKETEQIFFQKKKGNKANWMNEKDQN